MFLRVCLYCCACVFLFCFFVVMFYVWSWFRDSLGLFAPLCPELRLSMCGRDVVCGVRVCGEVVRDVGWHAGLRSLDLKPETSAGNPKRTHELLWGLVAQSRKGIPEILCPKSKPDMSDCE